jgi:hypothetical protein
MYDRFSDKGAHSTKWFVAKNFLKPTFSSDCCEGKCLWNRCQNSRMLFMKDRGRQLEGGGG